MTPPQLTTPRANRQASARIEANQTSTRATLQAESRSRSSGLLDEADDRENHAAYREQPGDVDHRNPAPLPMAAGRGEIGALDDGATNQESDPCLLQRELATLGVLGARHGATSLAI